MFRRRRANSLKRAMNRSGDPELRELNEAVSSRQERVAQLELELFDTRADLARFERDMEARLGPLQDKLADLEARISRARHEAARRAQWGDRVDSDSPPIDVVEQFRKTWTSKGSAPAPRAAAPKEEPDRASLKSLYRSLAKRFHPDLVTDPDEKRWREGVMAEVNAAYTAQDLRALEALAERPDKPEAEHEKTREEVIVELRAEITRLDSLITRLERELQQLVNSRTVQLMLEVSIARRAGRDMLGEMAQDLKLEIAQLEAELASL